MALKNKILLMGLALLMTLTPYAFAASQQTQEMSNQSHHHLMPALDDGRISLGLSPKMKLHQLANMRSHLEAIQTIIGLIAEGKFENAATIAHTKLGLTDQMKMMCSMFNNEDFTELGLSFHKSGDALGDALLSKDATHSLNALHTTMGYCIQCHANFRQ